jgi:hypothetical protein
MLALMLWVGLSAITLITIIGTWNVTAGKNCPKNTEKECPKNAGYHDQKSYKKNIKKDNP